MTSLRSILVLSFVASLLACSSGSGAARNGGVGADAGAGCVDLGDAAYTTCVDDPTVSCAGPGAGFTCAAVVDPESIDPTIACTRAVSATCNSAVSICCISYPAGTPCTPGDTLAACTDPASYGFQCSARGDDPSMYVAGLHCAAGTADPTTGATDVCCTF